MKCFDRVTLAVNGLDIKLGIRHIVRLVHVLDATAFRRERTQHGHQIVMVSESLPLGRRSICHHKHFSTRSVCVCMYVTSVSACLRVGGGAISVCTSLISVCVK